MASLDARMCAAICRHVETPCFVVFPKVMKHTAVALSPRRDHGPRVSFAYPIKTMPLAYLVEHWRRLGRYVEASSECELDLALRCKVLPRRIIVSGPAKSEWATSLRVSNLTVVIDSLSEIEPLAEPARRLNWRVGLRYAPKDQVDPDDLTEPDQFGIGSEEWPLATAALRSAGLSIGVLQFHLGGATGDLERRFAALREMAELARAARISPAVIDVGGGFPQAMNVGEQLHSTRAVGASIVKLCTRCRVLFPSCEELIVECGRALLGSAAVLVLRVIDVKRKYGKVFVICDGGRVNNALPSDWEEHELHFPSSARNVPLIEATICGPTCMAWDRLARSRVPADIAIGAFIVYQSAGAYHFSWQTSFSHRRASVVAVEESLRGGARIRPLLQRESVRDWARSMGARR